MARRLLPFKVSRDVFLAPSADPRENGSGFTALTIRGDRTPAVLRKLAKAETNTRVARRLLAIANALSGMSRKQAAVAPHAGAWIETC